MSDLTFTQADNGRTVTAQPGDVIIIRLPENPTTGYRWSLDQTQPGAELLGDSFALGADPQIGSGGTREYRFRSQGPGRIALKHWQPWEGEGSVTERFSLSITSPA